MYLKQAVLLLAFFYLAKSRAAEDPLCVQKACPSTKPCRVVTDCQNSDTCTIRAECFDQENLPQYGHTELCQIGDPILIRDGGLWRDTYCGPSLPCPNSTYCNSERQDTYATCCRSDPAGTVRPGLCPYVSQGDNYPCFLNCNSDGDCRGDDKCCNNGCSRMCSPPVFV